MKKQQFELFGLTFDIKNINQNKVITYDKVIIYTLHPVMHYWSIDKLETYFSLQCKHFGIDKKYIMAYVNEIRNSNYTPNFDYAV